MVRPWRLRRGPPVRVHPAPARAGGRSQGLPGLQRRPPPAPPPLPRRGFGRPPPAPATGAAAPGSAGPAAASAATPEPRSSFPWGVGGARRALLVTAASRSGFRALSPSRRAGGGGGPRGGAARQSAAETSLPESDT